MNGFELVHADCIAWMQDQREDSVDMVFGSPPYAKKGRRYVGSGDELTPDTWHRLMIDATVEAVRVSCGYVMWVVDSLIHRRSYIPTVERLMAAIHEQGITCERPVAWLKNSPPQRRAWFGSAWEYVIAFRKPDVVPLFDWEAVADSPVYRKGGYFRQRGADGVRRRGREYPQSRRARPRNAVYVTVGGGHMGYDREDDSFACQSEAPFPVYLAEHFILACSRRNGVVLDPFCGSGSTLAAAYALNRSGTGIEHGREQLDLAQRRLERLTTSFERGWRDVDETRRDQPDFCETTC